MTKSGGCQVPAAPSSKTMAFDSDFRHRKRRHRRRIQNPTFSVSGMRLGKDTVLAGKRSVPETPPLRWKINGRDLSSGKKPASEKRSRPKGTNGVDVSVSARKLASALWLLLLPEASNERGRGPSRWSSVHVVRHGEIPYLRYPIIAQCDPKMKNLLWGPLSAPHLKNNILYKAEPSVKLSNSAMEKATKWDLGLSKTADNDFQFDSPMKLLGDQHLITISVISALQAELEQSRTRIRELETDRHSSKKKLKHFLRKLAEERTSWRSQEHEKMHAVIDAIKDELNRERKNLRQMKVVNSKLFSELAEAKLSAKKFLQNYEKEKKARELIEEICDELTKKIGEDKAEVEDLKSESMRIREEVEEERTMLQMAEVWREERVQMKLIDAKVTFEEKYSQLRKLIDDLEAFLRSRSITANVVESREAELLRDAACSVKIEKVEFSYQPPTSEDIFSIFEDLRSAEANEREIEPCYTYSTTSPALEIHSVHPELNELYESQVRQHMNKSTDEDRYIEGGKVWETMSHGEEQGSCNFPEGRCPSTKKLCEESDESGSGTDWEENTDDDPINIEISNVCDASGSHARTKESSISSLRGPYPSYGEHCKTLSFELSNKRLAAEIASPDSVPGKGGLCPPCSGNWGSLDSRNSQITQEMKGCIKRPQGIRKSSLMAKILEERLESQKLQPHQVLQRKIQSNCFCEIFEAPSLASFFNISRTS